MNALLNGLTRFFTALMRKYLPDPFVFAILFTIVTFILSMFIQGSSVIELTAFWGKGFWSILPFTTQMATLLLTGYCLAKAPFIDKGVQMLTKVIKTPQMAVVAATVIGGIGSYLNWGFGLILGAMVARKLAQNVKGVHYPLIMAAAYSGFMFYGTGFTASIPITVATKGHFLESGMGVVPLTQTIFTTPILLVTLFFLITLPILNALMHPKKGSDIIELKPDPVVDVPASSTPVLEESKTLAERLNTSRLLNLFIVLLGGGYVVYYFVNGGKLDVNTVNMIMLVLGLMFLGTPKRYIAAISEAAKSVSGIILQYPFYAGIMGMMGGSGLVMTMAEWFVNIAIAQTLPFWGLISSYFINFFAPSAGGHWVIQGPFMVEAAKVLGADMGKMAMAVGFGNAWNDMIQPFWLLPTLAISGLKLSDVMGFCVVQMLYVGIIICPVIYVWGFM